MELVRRRIFERRTDILSDYAHLDALGRTAGIYIDAHVKKRTLGLFRHAPIDHDDQVKVAPVRIEAAHRGRAVKVYSGQQVPENSGGTLSEFFQKVCEASHD